MSSSSALLRPFIALAALALAVGLAAASEWSDSDRSEFQRIINTQISAFHADDGAKAYSFATPRLQKKFVNPSIFMQMVRTGYPAVYRARNVEFAGISDELGKPTQRVKLIGPDGSLWLGLYGFQKQPDGSWRISAVVIRKAPDAAA
ncbi:MAG: DUF4864 domain-containing protein [Pseudomonadota bacterium]